MSDTSGERLGSFRIEKELPGAHGSQGTVYRAVCVEQFGDVAPGTVVALKTMTVQNDRDRAFSRLKARTEKLMTMDDHPNIMRYYGCFRIPGDYSDLNVLVLEFLDGATLKEHIARKPKGMDADVVLVTVKAVANALQYAAKQGIVHRDVKPGNIFIRCDGSVKVIDFEIAKQEAGSASTTTAGFAGTFNYMAPEFLQSTFRGNIQSDLFSLGVVFHEALTGRLPYKDLDDKGQEMFVFHSRWAKLAEGDSPISISERVGKLLSRAKEVMEKALAPNPKDRYRDFAAFIEGISRIRFHDLYNGDNLYRLVHRIGGGGFGDVYKARKLVKHADGRYRGDMANGRTRTVAVKHLKVPAYSGRFQREADVLRRLEGPEFVHFVDCFEVRGKGGTAVDSFLVMDYLRGMPGLALSEVISAARSKGKNGLPWGDVFAAFVQYAQGLITLHAQKIYHRDIKPANLYYPVGHLSRAAIMDFGIVRYDDGQDLSRNDFPGTPDYMPPEAVLRRRSDTDCNYAPMDIFALGLSLYRALTGKYAYPRLPTEKAALAKLLGERVKNYEEPKFADPRVQKDGEVLSLLVDMTRPHVEERLADAAEVKRRLVQLAKRYQSGQVSDPPPVDPEEGKDTLLNPVPDPTATRPWEGPISEETPSPILCPTTHSDSGKVAGIFRWLVGGVIILLLGGLGFRAWQVYWNRPPEPVPGSLPPTPPSPPKPPPKPPVDPMVEQAESQAKVLEADFANATHATPDLISRLAKWVGEWNGKIPLETFSKLKTDLELARGKREHADEIKAAVAKAEAAMTDICARYNKKDESLEVVDGAFTAWETEWKAKLTDELLQPMKQKREEARRKRRRNDFILSCNELLAREPLDGRARRLGDLEKMLLDQTKVDCLRTNEVEVIHRNLDRERGCFLVKVQNQSGLDVAFEPEQLAAPLGGGETRLVALTNGLPAEAAFVSRGYEPVPLTKEDADRTRVLKRGDFRPKPVKVELPQLPEGVVCAIDGTNVTGEVWLVPGKHEVVWRNLRQTYPGVDDYKPVGTELDVPVDDGKPKPESWPSPEFQHSEAFKKRELEEAKRNVDKLRVQMTNKARTICENAKKNISFDGVSAKRNWLVDYGEARLGREIFDQTKDVREKWSQEIDAALAEQEKAKQAKQQEEARKAQEKAQEEARKARVARMQAQARAACSNICAKVQTRAWNPLAARGELAKWTVAYPSEEIGESLQAELKCQMEVAIVDLEQKIKYEGVLGKAQFDAENIARAFDDTSISASAAESKFKDFKIQYESKLNKEDFQELVDPIDKARQSRLDRDRKERERKAAEEARIAREAAERERAKQEAALLADVEKLLAPEPVTERLDRLDEAERLLAGERAKTCQLKSARKEEMQKKIDACRQWFVFKLLNRSDLEIRLGDERLEAGAERVFTFTGGRPSDLKVQCAGYQPIAVEAAWAEKEVPVENLRPLPVRVGVEGLSSKIRGMIGEQELVDGMELPPGEYTVRWTNGQQTYSGIDDYMPAETSMRLEAGRPIKLAPPKNWKPTNAFLNIQVNVRVPQLEVTAKCLIDEVSAPGGQVTRIRPGRHRIVFTRADYEDQTREEDIPYLGEKVYELKGPAAWQETEALRQLNEARAAFGNGTFRAEDYPACDQLRDPDHQREWTRMKSQSGKQNEIKALLKSAEFQYRRKVWRNVLKNYASAVDLGWCPGDDEYEQAKEAWNEWSKKRGEKDVWNERSEEDGEYEKRRNRLLLDKTNYNLKTALETLDKWMDEATKDWNKIEEAYNNSRKAGRK